MYTIFHYNILLFINLLMENQVNKTYFVVLVGKLIQFLGEFLVI